MYTDGSIVLTDPGAAASPLPSPTPFTNNYLYAPTTHRSGSCYEIGSQYAQSHLAPSAVPLFYVYDFCASPDAQFYYPQDQNANFFSEYDVRGGSSQPAEFMVAELRQSDGTDVALIENQQTQSWDVLYSTTGAPGGVAATADGWSFLETHYNPGLCPNASTTAMNYSYLIGQATPTPTGPTPAPTPSPIFTSVPIDYLYDLAQAEDIQASDWTTSSFGQCGVQTNTGDTITWMTQRADTSTCTRILTRRNDLH